MLYVRARIITAVLKPENNGDGKISSPLISSINRNRPKPTLGNGRSSSVVKMSKTFEPSTENFENYDLQPFLSALSFWPSCSGHTLRRRRATAREHSRRRGPETQFCRRNSRAHDCWPDGNNSVLLLYVSAFSPRRRRVFRRCFSFASRRARLNSCQIRFESSTRTPQKQRRTARHLRFVFGQ